MLSNIEHSMYFSRRQGSHSGTYLRSHKRRRRNRPGHHTTYCAIARHTQAPEGLRACNANIYSCVAAVVLPRWGSLRRIQMPQLLMVQFAHR